MTESYKLLSVVADWWIPGGEDDSTTPGTYRVLESGNALASLHRPLERNALSVFDLDRYPIVHGSAFGNPVTLVDARVGKARMGMGDQANIELRPRIAVEGRRLAADELLLTEAMVRIQRQDEWIKPRTIMVQRDPVSHFPTEISFRAFPTQIASIEGGIVGVSDFSSYRTSGSEVTVNSMSGFHFYFEKPVPLDEFIGGYLRGLQVLMTLVTGSRCGVESFRFTNDEWGPAHPSERWVDVRMFAPELKDDRARVTRPLFHFDAMDWEKQVPLIFGLSTDWRYVIEQWALLLDDRFVWPVARFATAASAVEALDRTLNPGEVYEPDSDLLARVAKTLKDASFNSRDRGKVKSALTRPKETSLEQRIHRLSQCAPRAMAQIVDKPQWASRVARLRHVVSHGLQSSEELWADVRAVQCGSEILLHLLECIFLVHLGFDGGQIEKMKSDNANTEYRKRVVEEYLDRLPPAPGQAAPAVDRGATGGQAGVVVSPGGP